MVVYTALSHISRKRGTSLIPEWFPELFAFVEWIPDVILAIATLICAIQVTVKIHECFLMCPLTIAKNDEDGNTFVASNIFIYITFGCMCLSSLFSIKHLVSACLQKLGKPVPWEEEDGNESLIPGQIPDDV